MKVAGYIRPWNSLDFPTGVGVHAGQMFTHLNGCPDVEFRTLSEPGDRPNFRAEAWPELAAATISNSELDVSAWQRTLGGLAVRDLAAAGDADWAYCPNERTVRRTNGRVAVTVHDLAVFEPDRTICPPKPLRTRLRWAKFARTLRRVDLILTVSEFTKSRLESLLGISPDRVAVIGNGVTPAPPPHEATQQATLAELGLTSGQFFVAVGSLTYRKGSDVLLDAITHLTDAGRSPLPVVVCGRRHEPMLLQRHAAGSYERSVPLAGYVGGDRYRTLLQHARALVFPSRYEGFGIPMIEAMAAGTPVVASDTAALPEIGGTVASYVRVGDKVQLAEQLDALTIDPVAFTRPNRSRPRAGGPANVDSRRRSTGRCSRFSPLNR